MSDEIVFLPANGSNSHHTNDTAHDEAVSVLAEQLGDIGKCSELQVFKCNLGSKNADQFCAAYPADKFTIASLYETVKATYGTGDFRILMYKAGHKGVFQNKLISIAPEIKTGIAAPSLPDIKGEFGQALQGLAQVILHSQQQQQQVLTQLLNRPQPDPQAQMMQQFALMKGLREAMGISGQPSAPATTTPTDPFAAMGNMMTGLVGLVTAFKTLAPEIGLNFGGAPVSDDNDSLIGLAKTVLPQIAGLVSNHQKIEAAKVTTEGAIVARRYAKNPAPRRHNAPPAQPAPNVSRGTVEILPAQVLDVLHNYAQQDVDTDEVAKQILPLLTPEIKTYVIKDNAFKLFVKAHPIILDNPEWWLDLLFALQELLENATVNRSTDNGVISDEPTTHDINANR